MKETIKEMRIADLKPAPYNPRKISKEALSGLKESIRKFGLVQPIIWNKKTERVVSGHQRLKALAEIGEKEALVLIVDWPDLQEKEANIAMNNRAIEGEFTDGLVDLLLEIKENDREAFDALLMDEISLKFPAEELLTNPADDVVPEKPKYPITKTGDLYILGEHRLLCGDATNQKDVIRLMDGKQAILMNTDPPYGIAYVQNAKSKDQAPKYSEIENDGLDGAKLQVFLESIIRTAVPYLTENCAFYLWHPMLTQGTFFAAAAAAADILIHRQIIWVKPSLVFGRGDYHWRHELCFYGWRKGHRPAFYGERNQTTIWEMGRENDGIHPTQKPVELFLKPILNHTTPGALIYEPFAGSGSQFIAAEKMGRRCFGMEIDPGYCDVIVKRWEDFSKLKAKLS